MDRSLVLPTFHDGVGDVATKETSSSATCDQAPVPLSGRALDLHKYLDTSRIQALEHLFAVSSQGIDLFSRLLACALTLSKEASSSPSVESGGHYAALISVESLAVLGRMIHCNSNETVTKYVKLLTLCGFLEKFKVKGSRRVYLAFPAGPYRPPSTLLADLDALLTRKAARPKVKALVRQIKERCIAYGYISADVLGLEEDVSSSLQHILTVLCSEEVDSTQRIASAVGMLTKLLVVAKPLSTYKVDAKVVDATTSHMGDAHHKPASVVSLPIYRAKESTLPVDASLSEKGNAHLAARMSTSVVDTNLEVHRTHPVVSTLQVDANSLQTTHQSATSPDKVDASLFKPENVVDVTQSAVDSSDPANVNVITIINTITFNVKFVAMFCCQVLSEPPKKWPVYRKLFQSPEVENDVQAITGALLFVLVHREDGSMRNPPAVFVQRCKDFHQAVPPNAKVFAEAMSLVERYGQLTYRELIKQLATQRAQTSQVQAWQPERQAPSTYQTPAGLQPIPSGKTQEVEVHIPLKSGGGMTWEVAVRLRRQIAHDIRFGRCRVTPVPLKDGSYGVLVDKSEEQKIRQYVLYTEQEWQQRSATLKSCYELFGGGVPQGLALLKKALRRKDE